jgi:hypothetical protein
LHEPKPYGAGKLNRRRQGYVSAYGYLLLPVKVVWIWKGFLLFKKALKRRLKPILAREDIFGEMSSMGSLFQVVIIWSLRFAPQVCWVEAVQHVYQRIRAMHPIPTGQATHGIPGDQ